MRESITTNYLNIYNSITHSMHASSSKICCIFYWLPEGAPVQIKINNSLTQIMKLESIVVDRFCCKATNIQYEDMLCQEQLDIYISSKQITRQDVWALTTSSFFMTTDSSHAGLLMCVWSLKNHGIRITRKPLRKDKSITARYKLIFNTQYKKVIMVLNFNVNTKPLP